MRQTSDIASYWDCLQEPRRRSGFSAGYLRLLAALDSGWRVAKVTKKQAPDSQGSNDEEYCFTLVNAEAGATQTLRLLRTQEIAQFISEEQLALRYEAIYYPI